MAFNLADAQYLNQQTVFYNTTDSSFVFEFLPLNVSTTFDVQPTFQPYDTTYAGFMNVSATARINVSAKNFSTLFRFQSNDITFVDYPDQDISYGVTDVDTFNGIQFSNASILNGHANADNDFLDNTKLEEDYVRYLAKAITGGYALADIFSNQEELITGIRDMDAPFCTALYGNVADNWTNTAGTNGMLTYPDGSLNMYTMSCKQLLEGMLKNTSSARTQVFLNDLAEQAPNADDDEMFYIRFHPGDVLAVRLAYVPKNGPGNPAGALNANLGNNPIYTRTYKVYLNMT